ncbi:uncharacterized protein isoform X2 [Rhodnius prolixus]|uniref:uncharacterized protein isoform X2 n=1 Tax=Rhodnius prolixus TaxID=13249 RepID=UPI003D1885AB
MNLILTGIFFLIFMKYVLSFNNEEELEIFHKNLEELTNQILNKYFLDKHCILLATERELFNTFFTDLNVTLIHVSPKKKNFCDRIMVASIAQGLKQKCDGYIIQLSDPKCFLRLWLKALHTVVNKHIPKFIFLPSSPKHNDYVDELFSMEESDVSAYIIAAEVDINSNDLPVILWTNDYSLPADTPGREKIFLDKWTLKEGFHYRNDLFYDKILDLKGRGVIGSVFTRKVEVGYVGIYQWPEVNFHIDYSASWLYSTLNLLVPKPVPISAWKTPILPFDWQIWLATFVSWIFGTIAFFTVSTWAIQMHGQILSIAKIGKLKRFSMTTMAVLGVLVLQSPPRYLLPKISSLRIVFICTELLALILTSCYAAELASYLTVPQFSKPVDTRREFVDSNLIWIAPHEVYTLSLKDTGDPIADKLVASCKVYKDIDELTEKAETGKFGVAIEVLPGGAVADVPPLTEKVITKSHFMKESLYGSPCALMFNKASPYVHHFNNMLHRLLDAGIITFWEEDVARKYMSVRKQMAIKESKVKRSENLVKKLTIDHVQGTFLIYTSGILCALITFLFEIYYFKKKQNQMHEWVF